MRQYLQHLHTYKIKQIRQKTNPKKLEEKELYCKIKHQNSMQIYNYDSNKYVDVVITKQSLELILAIQVYLATTTVLNNNK